MMLDFDLVLQASHEIQIRSLLESPGGHEAAATLLFGVADIEEDPWSGVRRRRFVSHAFQPIARSEVVDTSPVHITWTTDSLMHLFGEAAREGWIPAIVHTHPGGMAEFSEQDNRNEAELARTAELKGTQGLISIVINSDGVMAARIWITRDQVEPIDRILHAGPRIALTSPEASIGPPDFLDRQQRLFGDAANRMISNLRIGVVGGGGTGSAVLPLLMRHGVQKAILFERDKAELSNLNRLHGSRRKDVEDQTSKAEIHQRMVQETDIGMQLVTIDAFVGDLGTVDALKACDVVFSCTDDHAGRLVLNRFSRFYGIPVIDVGLAMQRRPDSGFDLFARVSTLVDGHPCLLCGRHIDPRRAHEEALKRLDSAGYEALKQEAYVLGEGDPAPAVAAFTTEAGCMAIGELLAALTGFHGQSGMHATRVRRFHAGDDRFPGVTSTPGCPACQDPKTLGRADVEPCLNMVL